MRKSGVSKTSTSEEVTFELSLAYEELARRTPRGSFADGSKNSLKAARLRSRKQAPLLRASERESWLDGLRQESQQPGRVYCVLGVCSLNE